MSAPCAAFSAALPYASLDVVRGTAAARPASALSRFRPTPFTPPAGPLANAHLQTIRATLRRAGRAEAAAALAARGVEEGVALPAAGGEDVLYVDVVGGAGNGLRALQGDVVLVLHGLESCSTGALTRRIAAALVREGFGRLVLMNFRSCAEQAPLPRGPRAYHAGFYDDPLAVLDALPEAVRRVWVVGFSLGANVLANLLAFLGDEQRGPAEPAAPAATDGAVRGRRVVAGAGLSTPWDPAACQRKLDAGFSGLVYARRLAASIAEKVVATAEAGVAFPEAMSLERVSAARRIGEIDDAYISPVFGFRGKEDYYRKVDPRACLSKVRVPAYFVGAEDDPFFDHGRDARGRRSRSLPTAEDVGNAPVVVYTATAGGHCGFMEAADVDGVHMYGPRELARFCAHVRRELDAAEEEERVLETEKGAGRPAKKQRQG